MNIYPAIDILGGKAVRLKKGDYNKVDVFGIPKDIAKGFEAKGAKFIHIVDLDAAKAGSFVNKEAICEIIKNVNVPVQLGGGIRSLEDIRERLEAGISRVIIGTAAINNFEMIKIAVKEFPGRIVAGIDSKNWKVAVSGWLDVTDVEPDELAKRFLEIGIDTAVFTDISRDGMMKGPSIEQTRKMVETGMKIIASGGVTTINDVKDVKEIGCEGAIIGRALYEGSIKLEEALEIC